MDVRFKDESLARLEVEADDGGYPPGVAKAFRKRMQTIRAATDERGLRAWKSLHFEKYGDQHSIRLNDQWRLILELEGTAPNKVVVVVSITDYH
jgi:proteic killer suppression protein